MKTEGLRYTFVEDDDEHGPFFKLEHWIPKSKGGADEGNTVNACARCNSRKGTLTGDEYLHRLVQLGEIDGA